VELSLGKLPEKDELMPRALTCPYLIEGFQWLRGNVHTHTTRSDGALTPEETAARYAERGYDFLALSDHDVLTWPVEPPPGLILIPAIEVGGGPHILAVNVEQPISRDQSRQDVLNSIQAAGGLAVLNHPNWETHFDHFPQSVMQQLEDYAGIEIYNGVVEFLEGSALATDRWDRLLSAGKRVWGFAHDDAHHEFAMGRGWLMVQVQDRTRSALIDAMREGRFYASTGVTIERIWTEDESVYVHAPDADRIRFYGQWGRMVQEVDSQTAGYRTGGREGTYVRIECLGRGGRCAWTQPIFIEDGDGGQNSAE